MIEVTVHRKLQNATLQYVRHKNGRNLTSFYLFDQRNISNVSNDYDNYPSYMHNYVVI